MLRRKLGNNGPDISAVGFGSWALGGPYKFGWGPVDDAESIAAIRRAVEGGVNWVDTAAVYGLGHSEEVVGRAVAPFNPGKDVYVFTKCGRLYERGEPVTDLRPESIRKECDGSLGRLGLERIDLYQIHWPDDRYGTPIDDAWSTLLNLAQEGKVRWCGVCNFDVPLLERCRGVSHIDSLQPPLNLINRSAAEDVIPWARTQGAGVIVYSPMASGLLTGKYTHETLDSLAEDDWRRRSPEFTEPGFSKNAELIERLKPISHSTGLTLAQLAIAWTLAVPGVTGAIVGARRAEQVDGWLPAADADLDEGTLAAIGNALDAPVA